MSSKKTNLSQHTIISIPKANAMQFGIVVAEWNKEITDKLLKACLDTLIEHGVQSKNIITKHVPGSFELPLGMQWLSEMGNIDAVIGIGTVIQGETRHFEFICQAVAKGIMDVGLQNGTPAIFGVLTTDNYQQALDRAGGKHGNKGVEAAITALKMVALKNSLE